MRPPLLLTIIYRSKISSMESEHKNEQINIVNIYKLCNNLIFIMIIKSITTFNIVYIYKV